MKKIIGGLFVGKVGRTEVGEERGTYTMIATP